MQQGNQDKSYIVFEGVIGAGKTTLATMLADKLDARLVVEQHEANPFLEDFYKTPDRFAFQTEMFFLLSRYRQQLDELAQSDLFHRHLIADYHFLKNRIFAHLTLEEREYTLYDHVASVLERDILMPDLMVYLKSNTQRLMYNIRIRGRSYEKNMQEGYISDLNEAYNKYFANYDKTPLLIVNATKLDFIQYPSQFEALTEAIMNAPDGRSSFNLEDGD
ncbi:deoxynucleoside kinase [bacterium]|nr:deoxynucleoside kinase [bacterium]